jgi:hypothetical protein
MNIYDENGELDIDAARRENDATAAIHGLDVRRTRYAELQIAALLDIAGSLRVVALEAGIALGIDEPTPTDEPEPDPEAFYGFFVVGDLVTVVGDTTPGEIVRLGFDQGEPFADVDFAESKGVRYYTRNLERLVGDRPQNPEAGLGLVGTIGVEDALDALRESDVPLVGVATEAETPALLTDEDEDGEEAVGGYELDEDKAAYERGDEAHFRDDLVDDIDADFDGAEHPNADDALAKLKANEAARKAGKSKGKKK